LTNFSESQATLKLLLLQRFIFWFLLQLPMMDYNFPLLWACWSCTVVEISQLSTINSQFSSSYQSLENTQATNFTHKSKYSTERWLIPSLWGALDFLGVILLVPDWHMKT
jgi:hypothetical protein